MMNEVDWCTMIEGRRDSMRGEDGIPYSAWRARAAGEVLYECYQALFRDPHAGIPNDMKRCLMVFLPKKITDQEVGEGVLRKPACTRPLSMTNTDAKLLSASMAVLLTRKVARHCLLRSPQKCFCGRDMLAN
eukprot:4682858-Pyramimonas_sp.AAC.1